MKPSTEIFKREGLVVIKSNRLQATSSAPELQVSDLRPSKGKRQEADRPPAQLNRLQAAAFVLGLLITDQGYQIRGNLHSSGVCEQPEDSDRFTEDGFREALTFMTASTDGRS